MALTKITKTGIGSGAVDGAKLEADSITQAKIADGAIENEHLNTLAITGQTELAEGAASTDVVLVYDASTGTLKKITQTNLLNFPTISSVSPTNVTSGDGTGNYTFTITGSGFIGASASLINNSGSVVSFDTVTVDSSTQITAVIAKSSLLNSGEPYDVKIVAASGLNSTLENQINIDAQPVFNTASGSLGTVINANIGSTTLDMVAFDPESAGNVTFEVITGSLPAGASGTTVNEDGVSKFRISGFSAVGSNTTSTFTVRAADVASNVSTREFSITINAPVSESFTTSGTFSVPSGITSVDVLVVAGGGGGGWDRGGGGGAGGLIFMPGFSVTPGGTVSVTVGNGGPGGLNPGNPNLSPTQSERGTVGQDSVFGTLTAKGGGGAGAASPNTAGIPGGSAGGASFPGSGGTATQPTQPDNSGSYGFGNPGGNSPGPATGGGGGGGAGASGSSTAQPNSTNPGGPGGVGRAYTIADGTTPVYYAGGGGGAPSDANVPAGLGGQGGGGNSAVSDNPSSPNAIAGQANKGGGGGGGKNNPNGVPSAQGAPGGSGIVIVRY